MGDPYAVEKPPSYEATDPYAVQKSMYDPNMQQQPMMLQPMGYSGQYNTAGQPMAVAQYGQPYPIGQPMMMAQPYGTMQPMMAQPYSPYVVQPTLVPGVTVNVQHVPQMVAVATPVAQVVVARAPEYNGFKKAIGVYEESLLCCCDDCETCCKGCVCPCYTYGRVARDLANGNEQMGDAACIKCCIGSLLGGYLCCALQQRIQVKTLIYGQQKSCDIEDFCAHLCCGPCALCQEERIMKEVMKEKKERAKAAPVVQFMS